MKALWDIIQAAPEEDRTYKQILVDTDRDGTADLKGDIAGHPVVITAILERTAVVHPQDISNKYVAALGTVKVNENDIVWVDKSLEEQRIARAAANGRKFGVITRTAQMAAQRAIRNL